MLPPQLKRRCIINNNDQDLTEAFIENHAVFQKPCLSVYNEQKLNRKRKHVESFNVRDAPENSCVSDPIEVRVNCCNVKLQNFIPNCFFCGEGKCEEKFHRCETSAVNQKERKIAHELGDTTIMAKLSEEDMIATEAIYHDKCLVNYYNRCRYQQLKVPGEDNSRPLAIMNGNS